MKINPLVLLLLWGVGGCQTSKNLPASIRPDRPAQIEYALNRTIITFRIAHNLIDRDLPFALRPNPVRAEVQARFARFKKHKVVETIKGLPFDDMVSGYLLHKKEFPDFGDQHDPTQLLVPLEAMLAKHGFTDVEAKLETLYVELYDFYRMAEVEQFITEQAYYTGALQEIRRVAGQFDMVKQMEEYTRQANDRYIISPEPLFITGGWRGIGPAVRTDSISYAYQFISPSNKFDLDTRIDPANPVFGFNDEEFIRNICVHEFGHTFVNPAFYRPEVMDFINDRKGLLTDDIKAGLQGSGIGGFYAYMIEHVVRLLEIRLTEHYLGQGKAQELRERNRDFIFLPIMEEVTIERFEADPAAYTTFAAFIPELLQVIDRQAH